VTRDSIIIISTVHKSGLIRAVRYSVFFDLSWFNNQQVHYYIWEERIRKESLVAPFTILFRHSPVKIETFSQVSPCSVLV
jgi:hypothetical protein